MRTIHALAIIAFTSLLVLPNVTLYSFTGAQPQAGVLSEATPTGVVTLNEHGLPTGALWAVAVGSENQSAAAPKNISYTLPYGNYTVNVYAPSGFNSIHQFREFVNGSQTFVTVYFEQSTGLYSIYFEESGLPSNSSGPYVNWGVTLNGSLQTAGTTTLLQSLAFVVPNGTYPYSIYSPLYNSSPNAGNVSVTGRDVYVNVSFSLAPPSNKTSVPLGTHPGASSGGRTPGFPFVWVSLLAVAVVAAVMGSSLVLYRLRGSRIGKPSTAYRGYIDVADRLRESSDPSRPKQ
jgi:hypothetical protein